MIDVKSDLLTVFKQENLIYGVVKRHSGQITGIDLGLKEFYTDAQGNTVENPRYLSKSEIDSN